MRSIGRNSWKLSHQKTHGVKHGETGWNTYWSAGCLSRTWRLWPKYVHLFGYLSCESCWCCQMRIQKPPSRCGMEKIRLAHARNDIHSHIYSSKRTTHSLPERRESRILRFHGGGWWRLDVFVVQGGLYMRDNCVYLIWNSTIRLMVFTTIFGKPRIHQSHSRITQGEFKECLRFAWGVFFVCFSALYNTIAV